jgi:hypothetical protein
MWPFTPDLLVALTAFWLAVGVNLMLRTNEAASEPFDLKQASPEFWIIFSGRYTALIIGLFDTLSGSSLVEALAGLIMAGLAGGLFIVGFDQDRFPSRKLILATAAAAIATAVISLFV